MPVMSDSHTREDVNCRTIGSAGIWATSQLGDRRFGEKPFGLRQLWLARGCVMIVVAADFGSSAKMRPADCSRPTILNRHCSYCEHREQKTCFSEFMISADMAIRDE